MASKTRNIDPDRGSADPEVVLEKSLSVPAVRTDAVPCTHFSLLDHVANSTLTLPRRYREERQFLRFLRRACTDPSMMEQVDRFRDAIILSAIAASRAKKAHKGGLTIALTGPAGHEGTSSLAVLLALSLGCCTHRRIALMDGSLNLDRFRAMTDFLGLTRNSISLTKGGSQVLGYFNEVQPNVYFLRNASPERDIEFFSDKQLDFFLSDLRQQFDFTIIDMPPLLKSTSGIFLAPAVDRLYVVAAVDRTRRSDVNKCVELVRQSGAEVSGIVLNQQKTPLWARLFWKEFFF